MKKNKTGKVIDLNPSIKCHWKFISNISQLRDGENTKGVLNKSLTTRLLQDFDDTALLENSKPEKIKMKNNKYLEIFLDPTWLKVIDAWCLFYLIKQKPIVNIQVCF